MGRYVIFAYPGEHGHLRCMATMARRLQRRGHEALFVGLEDDREWVEAEGLSFHAVFRDLFPAGFADRLKSRWRSAASQLRFALTARSRVERAIAGTPAVAAHLAETFCPDVAVCDALHPLGWFVAASLGVPVSVLHTTFPQARFEVPPVWTGLPDPSDESARRRTRWAWRRELWLRWLTIGHWNLPSQRFISRNLGESLVSHASRYGFVYSELPGVQLVACPSDLDFPTSTRTPSHYHYVESMVDFDRTEAPAPPLPDHAPLVLASLGTAAGSVAGDVDIARTLIAAFALLPQFTFVFSIGSSVRPEDLDAPANVRVYPFVPQLALLRRARLMVSHGGLGSVKEALLCGVPLVVTPLTRDQPGNAARVTHHGLGRAVDVRQASPPEVAAVIRAVMDDDACRQRVARFAERFRAMEEAQPSVRMLETLLASAPGRVSIRSAAAP